MFKDDLYININLIMIYINNIQQHTKKKRPQPVYFKIF